MSKSSDKLDKKILQAIQIYDAVPTVSGLARELKVAKLTIQRRINANPAINKAMEKQNKTFNHKGYLTAGFGIISTILLKPP